MAYTAVNNSNRFGTLYFDGGRTETIPSQSRVSIDSLPTYWTNNVRVVEVKESQKKPKKVSDEGVNNG
jgi:hypothetical protein